MLHSLSHSLSHWADIVHLHCLPLGIIQETTWNHHMAQGYYHTVAAHTYSQIYLTVQDLLSQPVLAAVQDQCC